LTARAKRAQRLHRAPEREPIARFDDQVRVIGQDRVLHEPEVLPRVRGAERVLDLAHDVLLPERRDVLPHLQRDVTRMRRGKPRALEVRYARVGSDRPSAAVAVRRLSAEVESELPIASHDGV
jgi:hypothetical protein